ncbi:hypothetical protein ARMGADRAFT_6850 [Armillaria gallica]|uniref:Uncharacterized protein n=1 Tax=Armillaria gallica TaxID=47427 RepID=A0A2H3EA42_ARMGA|nr:hypothetical protein ARMGADRAFT_6850 [Armillaria gallica]
MSEQRATSMTVIHAIPLVRPTNPFISPRVLPTTHQSISHQHQQPHKHAPRPQDPHHNTQPRKELQRPHSPRYPAKRNMGLVLVRMALRDILVRGVCPVAQSRSKLQANMLVVQRPGLPRRPSKLCAGRSVSRLPGGGTESRWVVAWVGWDDDEGPVVGPPLPVVGQDSVCL